MALSAGDRAPDFALPNQHREVVKLGEVLEDRAVVLVFFPWAFSSICGGELCSLSDQMPQFSNDRVATLAVSTDAHFTLAAWAEDRGFSFDLLSDSWPHGEVARAYGIFNDTVGVAERGTFVIDREGVVRYAVHNPIGDARDDQAYLDALEDIGAA